LTASDIGAGFVEESRGDVGVSGGRPCPDSQFRFEDAGVVRVAFERASTATGEVAHLIETIQVLEPADSEGLIDRIGAGYEACYGDVWTDYGDTRTVEAMTMPAVGDPSFAVRWLQGDAPFDGRIDEERRVYVLVGDTFVTVTAADVLQGRSAGSSLTSDQLYDIVLKAIERLG
jgi:hypothetical protein